MLPKTKLGRAMFDKLKVYAGDKHPAPGPEAAAARPQEEERALSTTPNEYYATGKRKTSIARVHLRPGTGEIKLNEQSLDEYFGGHEALKLLVRQPFALTETSRSSTCWRSWTAAAWPPRRARCATGSRARSARFDLELRKQAQEGGLPHAGRPHQGAQEVRAEGRPPPLPVQQALMTSHLEPLHEGPESPGAPSRVRVCLRRPLLSTTSPTFPPPPPA